MVLTRKLNETIVIDGNVTVTVVEVRGNRVKLGIIAPKEVPVMREEIAKHVVSKNETGSQTNKIEGSPKTDREHVGTRLAGIPAE